MRVKIAPCEHNREKICPACLQKLKEELATMNWILDHYWVMGE